MPTTAPWYSEIFDHVRSPAYLFDLVFAVVLLGILINLFSSYLKTPTDKLLSSISSSWRCRRQRELELQVELNRRVAANADNLQSARHLELRYRQIEIDSFMSMLAFYILTIIAPP